MSSTNSKPGGSFLLRIEHPVRDFASWKKVFDSDPGHRKHGGVLRYRIYHLITDPNHVFIDLEFNDKQTMEKFLGVLQSLWAKVDGKLIDGPKSYSTKMIEYAEVN